MIRQEDSARREEIVARALAPVVGELRLVDAADYVAFIRTGSRAALEDIMASAAERRFMPGALRLGAEHEADLDWGEQPRISLGLEFWLRGVTVHFRLAMDVEQAGVEIAYCDFANPAAGEAENTEFLAAALEDMRIRPTRKVATQPERDAVGG